jgi:hypothetical protein
MRAILLSCAIMLSAPAAAEAELPPFNVARRGGIVIHADGSVTASGTGKQGANGFCVAAA